FVYVGVLSVPGAWGTLRILRHSLGGDWDTRQRRKSRALGGPGHAPTVADLNVLLEQQGRPGQPFELTVGGSAGRMGRVLIDGARISYLADNRAGANEVLAFVERQVEELVHGRGQDL